MKYLKPYNENREDGYDQKFDDEWDYNKTLIDQILSKSNKWDYDELILMNTKELQSILEGKEKMKHLNESENLKDDLIWVIEDLINDQVYLRDVPYSMSDDKEKETDPESVKAAAKAIVDMLNERGLI